MKKYKIINLPTLNEAVKFEIKSNVSKNSGVCYCTICNDALMIDPMGVSAHVRKHIRAGEIGLENKNSAIKAIIANLQ